MFVCFCFFLCEVIFSLFLFVCKKEDAAVLLGNIQMYDQCTSEYGELKRNTHFHIHNGYILKSVSIQEFMYVQL